MGGGLAMFNRVISKISGVPQTYIGSTGRSYQFEQLLQQREHFGRIWLATNGETKFILKDIPELIHDHFNTTIQPNLPKSRFIRVPLDVIPEQRIFVYKHLTEDLLSLVRKGISTQNTKRILKDTLQGLVELHSHDIVHLDVKPDNILIDHTAFNSGLVVDKVQLTDLENAAHLPDGRYIKNMLAGNENWRSPEAAFKSGLGRQTDVYSFGLVCIYSQLNRILLGEDDDFRKHIAAGALPDMIRLQRAISYFGTHDSVDGLMTHLGDGDEQAVNRKVLEMIWEGRHGKDIPYRPFAEWKDGGDEVFKDFVSGMLHLDPRRRMTAKRALEHEWWEHADEQARD